MNQLEDGENSVKIYSKVMKQTEPNACFISPNVYNIFFYPVSYTFIFVVIIEATITNVLGALCVRQS